MFKTQIELMETGARQFAYSLSTIYAAGLLLDHAGWSKLKVDAEIARSWCYNKIITPQFPDLATLEANKLLGLDLDPSTGKPKHSGDICSTTGKPRPRL